MVSVFSYWRFSVWQAVSNRNTVLLVNLTSTEVQIMYFETDLAFHNGYLGEQALVDGKDVNFVDHLCSEI